jgi:hypothetical protein
MPASQVWQTTLEARRTCCTPVGLRLAVLAAVVACALPAPLSLLQPQADGGRDVPLLPRTGVENSNRPTLTGPAGFQCTALLRDSAVVRRLLSRCADSFAASEARAVTLALKLRASNRKIGRLVRENAEIRARLEAVPKTMRALAETVPAISPHAAIASSVDGNIRTATHMRGPGRNVYPSPLPVSGT